jgi:methyl-accepting chemotaxis protein-like sensor
MSPRDAKARDAKPGDPKPRDAGAREATPVPASRAPDPAPAWGALVVALGSALAAGATGHLVPGNPGWVAVGVVSVLAGAVALLFVKGPGASRGPAARPGGGESRGSALLELESIRHQIDVATTTLRGGRDPLAVVSELGMGPLHGLLEAVRDAGASGPTVSRIAIDEAELVGTDGEQLPEPWPADADAPPAFDPRLRADALEGVDQMIAGLEALSREMGRPAAGSPTAPAARLSDRTPAQFVDAVVQTAADGIEDLAAGLMRANELASVAERVTNRATLLALNAALEATRSGSEAFAAIAEETRRLAEFAREATDTISRLANEIEYKVGQTITAIHSTSEDAKHAVAAISGAPPLAAAASPEHQESVDALLTRAREVRKSLTATMPARRAKKPRPGSGSSAEGGMRAEGAHAAQAETTQAQAPPPFQTGTDPAPEPGQPG